MSALSSDRFPRSGYISRSTSSGLADVLDVLLDKGLVVDIFLRVSLVGIELLTVDARIVIASVDTYLRFAEAVNRLELGDTSGSEGLPQLIEDMTQDGAEHKTKGVLEGAKESLFGSGGSSDDNDDNDDNEESDGSGSRGARRSATGSRSRSRSSSRGSSSRGRS